MEVVINKCFGGFGISNKAVERYFELKGQKIWFYKETDFNSHVYVKTDCNDNSFYVNAYSKDFGSKTNEDIDKYSLYNTIRNIERDDPILVKVVKELGTAANDTYSYLKIVEIPDNIEWEINNYDGMESISESHRTWD